MEGGNKEGCPQLLDLIHKDGEWVMRGGENEGSFGVEDEKKLELRLGPPGEDWSVIEEKMTLDFSLPLGCSNTWGGSSSQKPVFSSPWNTNPSAYLQFLSVKAMESTKTCCTKGVGELQGEKKACSLPCAAPANTAVNNSSQKRSAPAPVVGWPPVRSFRKNLANSSSTKQAVVDNTKKESCCNKGMFVKINMDGVAIGRKVDIKAYDSYESLSSAVDELFRGLLAAQRDSPVTRNPNNKVEDVKEITGLLDGSGEYTLVYEDNEGDRMLAGDVPWNIFASTVKRLRVLKSCELSSLSVGIGKHGKEPV